MAKKLKDGDRFVFNSCKANKLAISDGGLPDVTVGKIYTVAGESFGDLYFYDDVGERNYSVDHSGAKITKIVD